MRLRCISPVFVNMALGQGGKINLQPSRRRLSPTPAPVPRAAVYNPPLAGSLHTTPCVSDRHASPNKMAAKFIVLVSCLALTQAALVKRDAPASTPLQDLEKHAVEFQKTFSEQLNALSNSKTSQDFTKSLKEGTDSVLQQISALSTTLQGAIADANGKAKEALEATRTNLEKQADELRKAHPDVEKKANELKDKLVAAVQNTVQETQKLAKEVQSNVEQTNSKLAPQIKQAYDDFVKQAQDVQKKLHEAATKQ